MPMPVSSQEVSIPTAMGAVILLLTGQPRGCSWAGVAQTLTHNPGVYTARIIPGSGVDMAESVVGIKPLGSSVIGANFQQQIFGTQLISGVNQPDQHRRAEFFTSVVRVHAEGGDIGKGWPVEQPCKSHDLVLIREDLIETVRMWGN